MIVHLPRANSKLLVFFSTLRSWNLIAAVIGFFQKLFLPLFLDAAAAASPNLKADIDKTGKSPVAVAQHHMSYWIEQDQALNLTTNIKHL